MKEHEFTLVLRDDPDEAEADRLYAVVNDGTLSTIGGTAQIRFHREAPSLEAAIRSALESLTTTGFEVTSIEIEPQALAKIA